MKYNYKTHGTCSKEIIFDIDENSIITNILFIGGCNGNLNAISKLLDGLTAKEINNKCADNPCKGKNTSCTAQLAIAVLESEKALYENKSIVNI